MKKNFLITGLLLLLSGAVFYLAVTRIDPLGIQQNLGYAVFFLSVFCFFLSFFTFFCFFGKELIMKKKLGEKSFKEALRRGLIISLFLISILVLQLLRMFEVFEVLLLASFFGLVEYMFLEKKEEPQISKKD